MKARAAQVLAQSAATLFTRPRSAGVQTVLNCVVLIAVFVGVLGVAGCAGAPAARTRGAAASQDPPRPDDPTPASVSEDQACQQDTTRLARDWGIEILGLNLSAAGYMLDFRYRVTDPEKAAEFMNRAVKPYLVDQATGAKLFVPRPPKVGSLRQTSRKPVAGRTYFILFANPGRFLAAGDNVTLHYGDCEFKNLVVNGRTAPSAAAALNTRQCIDKTP